MDRRMPGRPASSASNSGALNPTTTLGRTARSCSRESLPPKNRSSPTVSPRPASSTTATFLVDDLDQAADHQVDRLGRVEHLAAAELLPGRRLRDLVEQRLVERAEDRVQAAQQLAAVHPLQGVTERGRPVRPAVDVAAGHLREGGRLPGADQDRPEAAGQRLQVVQRLSGGEVPDRDDPVARGLEDLEPTAQHHEQGVSTLSGEVEHLAHVSSTRSATAPRPASTSGSTPRRDVASCRVTSTPTVHPLPEIWQRPGTLVKPTGPRGPPTGEVG